jgi:exodeoxyribonuclease III
MRIASFNINGTKARLPRLLEWLEERRPAVACLQEIKCADDAFPASEFEKIA